MDDALADLHRRIMDRLLEEDYDPFEVGDYAIGRDEAFREVLAMIEEEDQ